jgi:hypothetical protein
MARKRKGRYGQQLGLNLRRARNCAGCSVFSWEQKKFDRFNELFFADSLKDTSYEQHILVPPPCLGGVECNICGHFLCHDCVCAFHLAIKKDHPDLQDAWLQATMHSSPQAIVKISVGNCCELKEKQVEEPIVHSLSSAPILAGANHYYQYDLSIGSTPRLCVDVFSLGASRSNSPVTHAVFPIEVALNAARENHSIPLLPLDGPTLRVHSSDLLTLPSGFNKSYYMIKVVTTNCTRTDSPTFGKINICMQ